MSHIFPGNFIKATRSRISRVSFAKCVSITIVTSNINEFTRAILNFFYCFYEKSTKQKRTKHLPANKNAPKKHLRGKK